MIGKYINSYKLVLILMASALLTACSTREEDIDNSSSQRMIPLQLSSGIKASVTRAFDTTWDIGNAIGVFTTPAGDNTQVTRSGSYNDENIGYGINTEEQTYDGSSYSYKPFTALTGKQVYLPANGSAVDVYAYYPYLADAVTASVPLSITVTGTSATSTPSPQTTAQQKGFDVLSAKVLSTNTNPIDIDNPSVNLLFEHVMTKVIVYVMAGTGIQESELSVNNVSSVQLLGQPVSAPFAPITQVLTITTGSNVITMQEITSDTTDPDYVATYTIPGETDARNVLHVYRAIVLPNNTTTNPYTSTDRKIRFNVGQTNYTYTIPQIDTETPANTNYYAFESGKEMRFAVRLSATGIEAFAAIKDWTEQGINPNPLYPDGE